MKMKNVLFIALFSGIILISSCESKSGERVKEKQEKKVEKNKPAYTGTIENITYYPENKKWIILIRRENSYKNLRISDSIAGILLRDTLIIKATIKGEEIVFLKK